MNENENENEKLDINHFSKKETYSPEEKQIIMDRLNEERLRQKKEEESISSKKSIYLEDEKKKILSKINEKRLSVQKREEIKKSRTHHKKTYKFEGKEFYKFINMEREYYIRVDDCQKFSSHPAICTLYYRIFESLQKKDVLIKTEIYSDKFFISYDAIRVYFKGYALEDER